MSDHNIHYLRFTYKHDTIRLDHNSTFEYFLELDAKRDDSISTYYIKKYPSSLHKKKCMEKLSDLKGNQKSRNDHITEIELGNKILDVLEKYFQQHHYTARFNCSIGHKKSIDDKKRHNVKGFEKIEHVYDILSHNDVRSFFPGISDHDMRKRYDDIKEKNRLIKDSKPEPIINFHIEFPNLQKIIKDIYSYFSRGGN